MDNFIFIVICVGVAALIGGMTNYFAIRMLFRPRKALFLFGKKLPFTPGLIPKRKDEIAAALGDVVSRYLVTSEGLSEALRHPMMAEKLERSVRSFLQKWGDNESTTGELMVRWLTEERWIRAQQKISRWLDDNASIGIRSIWKEFGIGNMTINRFVSSIPETEKEERIASIAKQVIIVLQQEVHSLRGELLLQKIVSQFIKNSGTMLTALTMFMDEKKIVKKLQKAIFDGLHNDAVQTAITQILIEKWQSIEQLTIDELSEMAIQMPSHEWIERWANQSFRSEMIMRKVENIPVQQIMHYISPWVDANLSKSVYLFLNWIDEHLESLIVTLELPSLVEKQVNKFPVERLENILISLSGKEFRAITWLGALLGGMIGLFQSIFMLFYQ